MKVLLTGANGFVGSHILDTLCAQSVSTVILLRKTSQPQFIEQNFSRVEARYGSVSDPDSLSQALEGITHVIHCAGIVKALRQEEFFAINKIGARNIIQAVNARGDQIRRLVLISSMAAAGPGIASAPIREQDTPRPVSIYGKSKLGGEQELRQGCKTGWTIIRPPGIYGPRDMEFLRVFKAVQNHFLPNLSLGRQSLSLVYVRDLAETIVASLTHPAAQNETFFVASPEIATSKSLGETIASAMKTWTIPLPIPTPLLWPACQIQEALSRLTGKPNVLSRQKYAELSAPGWVCDASKLERVLGLKCPTRLSDGVAQTLDWYRAKGWL